LTESVRAIVIGGGVIGLATARALALRNASVIVLDDAMRRAGTASWAAAGMLSPLAETGDVGPLHSLADASLDRFADFVRDIEAVSGVSVEYRTTGKLHVATTAADAGEIERLAALPAAGRFGVELLDAAEARTLEPALGPNVRGALLVRRDHRVDNRRLHEALCSAAAGAGVELVDATVEAVDCVTGRVRGVILHDTRAFEADAIVLAAGAWSGSIGGIDAPPVRPVRGQMLAVRSAAPLVERVVASPRCYLIPRDGGRLLIGATVEEAGFEAGGSEAELYALLAAARELVPEVETLPVVERWFGFRPGTPDALPVLGADDRVEGLYHATGHYRNGILLAPITAELVSAAVMGEAPAIPLAPFSIARLRA
jgi:glycine oxidase